MIEDPKCDTISRWFVAQRTSSRDWRHQGWSECSRLILKDASHKTFWGSTYYAFPPPNSTVLRSSRAFFFTVGGWVIHSKTFVELTQQVFVYRSTATVDGGHESGAVASLVFHTRNVKKTLCFVHVNCWANSDEYLAGRLFASALKPVSVSGEPKEGLEWKTLLASLGPWKKKNEPRAGMDQVRSLSLWQDLQK